MTLSRHKTLFALFHFFVFVQSENFHQTKLLPIFFFSNKFCIISRPLGSIFIFEGAKWELRFFNLGCLDYWRGFCSEWSLLIQDFSKLLTFGNFFGGGKSRLLRAWSRSLPKIQHLTISFLLTAPRHWVTKTHTTRSNTPIERRTLNPI